MGRKKYVYKDLEGGRVRKLERYAGWQVGLALLLSMAMLAPASALHAQASVYVEGTANYLDNGPYTDFLSGGTAGLMFDLVQTGHDNLTISVDLQGNFSVSGTEPVGLSDRETYDAVTAGPRFSLKPHFFKLAPYAQLNVGFARYWDPLAHSTTDNVIGGQAGVARRLSSRFDAVVDYSYSHYGYNFGYYSPQTFSAGVVWHFVKR